MPIRARKDIICYKVLRVTPAWGYTIITPVFGCKVSRNGILQAMGKKLGVPIHSSIGYKYIGAGAIHAYTNSDIDIENATSMMYFLTKCTIRKGTLYYKSCDGKQIAAERMEIVKIVKYPTDPGLEEFLKEFIDNYFTNLKSI